MVAARSDVSLVTIRGRVATRIASAAAYPIVLILAPAGYGKSIALGHHLATQDKPWIVFQLGREHGSLIGFVRGLADMLAEVAPGIMDTVLTAVQSAQRSASCADWLADWMSNHLRAYDGILAIDDFHIAERDAECAPFVAALIERTKHRLQWIISARSATQLPISSWIVHGDADAPLGEADLRLTATEANQLAQASASPVDAITIERLMHATGGWPTAIGLALRVSQHTEDIERALLQARRLSYRYLAENVYNACSPEEQMLLTFGAVLPEFDVLVLEQAGFANVAPSLERLHEWAGFLSLDAKSSPHAVRYRCHDLFRAFLEHELKGRGTDVYESLRLRAACALRDAGRIAPALQLFAEMGAGDEVLALLESHGFALIDTAHSDTVQQAIDVLAEGPRNAHPVILGLRAQLAFRAERYSRAEALLERAITLAEDHTIKATLLLILAQAFSYQHNAQKCLAAYESALGVSGIDDAQRGDILSAYASSRAFIGAHDGLPALLDQVEYYAQRIDSDALRAKMLQRGGLAATIIGDSTRAQRLLALAAELASQHELLEIKRGAYAVLSINALSREDDLPKALAFAQIESETAIKCGEPYHIRGSLLRMLSIEMQRGNPDAVADILKRVESLPHSEDPGTHAIVQEGRAMLAAWDGDFEEAYRILEAVSDQMFLPDMRVVSRALCAVFLAAIGESSRSQAIVESILGNTMVDVSALQARHLQIAQLLCGLSEALAGRQTSALKICRRVNGKSSAFAHALRSAVIEINRCGIQACAPQIQPWIEAMRQCHYGGYARIIERATETRADQEEIALTPAERAVLQALADGNVPKEIAEATGCSVNTVRVHVRRIIEKFRCNGREQAVRLARARGII